MMPFSMGSPYAFVTCGVPTFLSHSFFLRSFAHPIASWPSVLCVFPHPESYLDRAFPPAMILIRLLPLYPSHGRIRISWFFPLYPCALYILQVHRVSDSGGFLLDVGLDEAVSRFAILEVDILSSRPFILFRPISPLLVSSKSHHRLVHSFPISSGVIDLGCLLISVYIQYAYTRAHTPAGFTVPDFSERNPQLRPGRPSSGLWII